MTKGKMVSLAIVGLAIWGVFDEQNQTVEGFGTFGVMIFAAMLIYLYDVAGHFK